MKFLLLSILLGANADIPANRAAMGVCPAEADRHRSTANRFLTLPVLTDARNKAGIYTPDVSQLRLLTDATDSATCQRLNEVSVSGGVLGTTHSPWVYYQLGSQYIVVSAAPPVNQPGMLSTRMRFVAVLDAQFNFVKGYGI